jgi:multiple sugar transport system ATP-binding protein
VARIVLEHLVKRFGPQITAVAGVDLEIADGEFMVFVGPSGCGKTTTLNMICGLEQPSSGNVIIGERIVNDLEPGERQLGMVFQNLALFPHLSVFENVAFGLRVQKRPEREIRERVGRAVETFRISHLLPKRPGQCSGGEAQRVALARTVITDPAVLLMDEPLSSLDAKLRVEMRTELKRLHERLRSTFVYVTHDQAEAMTMADRIMVMQGGKVQQVGTPLDIYRRPANLFVASFFGMPAMNLIRGRCHSNGSARFQAAGLELDIGNAATAAAGQDIVLGVRAEHVRIGDDAGAAAQVRLIEPLGDETLLYIDYGAEAQLVAKVDAEREFRVGDAIRFSFNPGGVLLFAGDSETRLESVP